MIRTILVLTCFLSSALVWASDGNQSPLPSFEYEIARAHELKPHRQIIPLKGMSSGFHQLRIMLTVSPSGEVVDAVPGDDPELSKFWPQLQGEVRAWKFTPFEEKGTAVKASVEEYIDLVPPERFPVNHVAAPPVRPNSRVTITLVRTMCYGRCPAYTVTVGTRGIVFEGGRFVVALGKHTAPVEAEKVRELAKKFVAADFYSMDTSYQAHVTDNPTFELSIAVDGHTKKVVDYVGSWVGMPAVITDLEDSVDELARTERWIAGSEGLVQALKAENFNFKSGEAEEMMREASRRGKTATVKEFVEAGVPPDPFSAP